MGHRSTDGATEHKWTGRGPTSMGEGLRLYLFYHEVPYTYQLQFCVFSNIKKNLYWLFYSCCPFLPFHPRPADQASPQRRRVGGEGESLRKSRPGGHMAPSHHSHSTSLKAPLLPCLRWPVWTRAGAPASPH